MNIHFFVSAVKTNAKFSISIQECVDYIKSYRSLARGQRDGVITVLRNKMDPKKYSGNKTNKRDFNNWMNKNEQIFSVITETAYFEQREGKLMSRQLKDTKGGTTTLVRLCRSMSEKFKYFSKHNIGKLKILGFELHHVVPLSWAGSLDQFKLLDVWKNMVYIDGYSHAQITQNNNSNVIMSNKNTTVVLSDYLGNKVELVINRNIQYLPANLPTMLDYNEKLRNMYETTDTTATVIGASN